MTTTTVADDIAPTAVPSARQHIQNTNVVAAYEFATLKLFLKLTAQKDGDKRFLKTYISYVT